MRRSFYFCLLLAVGITGCSDDSPSSPNASASGGSGSGGGAGAGGTAGSTGHAPATYPLSPEPYTTLQMVWEPLVPPTSTTDMIAAEELVIFDLERYESAGLGVRKAPGNPWLEHAELAPDFVPAASAERRSLLYVWQAADPQIIDEESPVRFEAFPMIYRPSGHLTLQTFEAHVRTASRISQASGRPFDFALIAGDLTDGSHRNELEWMLTALNGGDLDPDSGVDDDPVAGPGNDYNDPFVSEGLPVDWYAALGNHETLYNGGFDEISEEIRSASVGEEVYDFLLFDNGFRDGATLNAEVRTEGPTPADPRRLVLRRGEVLETLQQAAGSPAGHGLSAADVDAERGYFSVSPMSGKPIRLITLDTVNSKPGGIGIGALGFVQRDQFDWFQAELAAADAKHELIVIMSHHRVTDLSDTSPVSEAELVAAMQASEGVVLQVTGHGHRNRKKAFPSTTPMASSEYGYWELMLASTVDFPMHSRAIEIVNSQNGFISVYATNIGHNSPAGTLAHQAIPLAAARWVFPSLESKSEVAEFWATDVSSQNLLLHIKIPDAVSDELAKHEWPSRIESTETLAGFSAP